MHPLPPRLGEPVLRLPPRASPKPHIHPPPPARRHAAPTASAARQKMVSKGTDALLTQMMKDANLNAYQQRKLRAVAHGRAPVVDRRAAIAKFQSENGPRPYEDPYRGLALNPRVVMQGRRSQQVCTICPAPPTTHHLS